MAFYETLEKVQRKELTNKQAVEKLGISIDKYDIRPLWVGYDPWNSQYWPKEMEDMGFEMEKIRQGVYILSEPMKQLEADLRHHALNYNNNPIIKWCLANTQAKVDINGNIQPSKLNSRL